MTNIRAVRRILAVAVMAAVLTPTSLHSQTSSPDDLVWHWFGKCKTPKTLKVEIRFDRQRVFASSFPICLVRRADQQNETKRNNLRFSFKAPVRIFGDDFASLGTSEIEGNVWEAGSEQRLILLGVSFMTKDRILLNTIHLASANSVSRAPLAERLVMTTVVQAIRK